MCGYAEASLAVAVISATMGYMESQNQAAMQRNRQAQMDRAAYANYQLNVRSLNEQREQVKEQGAQRQMAQTIEAKQAEGKSRVHFGEVGLGQMALQGNSVDSHFNDILFQTATGRARISGDVENAQSMIGLQQQAAYGSYLAQNASFAPIFNPSPLKPIMAIASAGDSYMGNKNRRYFKDASGSGGSGMFGGGP